MTVPSPAAVLGSHDEVAFFNPRLAKAKLREFVRQKNIDCNKSMDNTWVGNAILLLMLLSICTIVLSIFGQVAFHLQLAVGASFFAVSLILYMPYAERRDEKMLGSHGPFRSSRVTMLGSRVWETLSSDGDVSVVVDRQMAELNRIAVVKPRGSRLR